MFPTNDTSRVAMMQPMDEHRPELRPRRHEVHRPHRLGEQLLDVGDAHPGISARPLTVHEVHVHDPAWISHGDEVRHFAREVVLDDPLRLTLKKSERCPSDRVRRRKLNRRVPEELDRDVNFGPVVYEARLGWQRAGVRWLSVHLRASDDRTIAEDHSRRVEFEEVAQLCQLAGHSVDQDGRAVDQLHRPVYRHMEPAPTLASGEIELKRLRGHGPARGQHLERVRLLVADPQAAALAQELGWQDGDAGAFREGVEAVWQLEKREARTRRGGTSVSGEDGGVPDAPLAELGQTPRRLGLPELGLARGKAERATARTRPSMSAHYMPEDVGARVRWRDGLLSVRPCRHPIALVRRAAEGVRARPDREATLEIGR